MKKHLATFAAALLLLGACSKNDDNSTPPTPNPAPAPTPAPPAEENSLLPKRAISTNTDGSVETITYSYDGNRFKGNTSQIKNSKGSRQSSSTLTYEGNLLRIAESNDGENHYKGTFNYENGLLKSRISENYTVWDDGTIYSSVVTNTYTYSGGQLASWKQTSIGTETAKGKTRTTTFVEENTLEYLSPTEVKIKGVHNSGTNSETTYAKVYLDADGDVLRHESFAKDGTTVEYHTEFTYTSEGGNDKILGKFNDTSKSSPENRFVNGVEPSKKNRLTKKEYSGSNLTKEINNEYFYDAQKRLVKTIETTKTLYAGATSTQTTVYEY